MLSVFLEAMLMRADGVTLVMFSYSTHFPRLYKHSIFQRMAQGWMQHFPFSAMHERPAVNTTPSSLQITQYSYHAIHCCMVD
jgi:hypothetical protein